MIFLGCISESGVQVCGFCSASFLALVWALGFFGSFLAILTFLEQFTEPLVFLISGLGVYQGISLGLSPIEGFLGRLGDVELHPLPFELYQWQILLIKLKLLVLGSKINHSKKSGCWDSILGY